MRISRSPRAWLIGVPAGLLLLALALALTIGWALRSDAGRRKVVGFAAARLHHPIEVRGDLDLRFASGELELLAHEVTVRNPPWMPAGRLAELGAVRLTFDLSAWHLPRLRGITLSGGTLDARRNAEGAANWTVSPRDAPGDVDDAIPSLRSLRVEDVKLRLVDERRHLDFDGDVATPVRDDGRFHLEATGRLNGRDTQVAVTGEPLEALAPGRPWAFVYDQQSSGTQLHAAASLPRPFSFARIDAPFEATGADLRDLYYLLGMRLPDTGRYTVKGRFVRDGSRFEFHDLALQTGGSDLDGRIVAMSEHGLTIDAELHSHVARIADVGAGAAGRRKGPAGPRQLLSDWRIPREGLRLRLGRFRYRADTLQLGPFTLHDTSVPVRIENGVLTAEPLHARTDHGEARGRVTFDARGSRPHGTARLEMEGLELGNVAHKGAPAAPAVSGPLDGRLVMEGDGVSVHEVFASGTGRLRLSLSSGELRRGLAEAMGLDLRALGLSLARQDDRVPLRCGVLEARIADGRVQSETLVIDTESVTLSGAATLLLQDEALDVTLHAKGKRPGLRLHTPLRVAGRLLEPAPRLEARSLGRQGAAAMALGALVAPAAAAAAFFDPGLARDADCGALLTAKSD